MKSETSYPGALRLDPCTYGLSKLSFRGPRRRTDGRYIAFLGGTDTFGKYIPKPFVDLVETAIGEVCVNLGCPSAGPDVFLHDTAVQSLCHDAQAVVIQIPSATNLSNAFYRVHPRRNDRFIAPTDKLRALYPEIDFTEIAFTGHLIQRLRAVDEGRFVTVRRTIQATWMHRMKVLARQPGVPTILLWMASRAPQNDDDGVSAMHCPAFVTGAMVDALRSEVADIIEVVASRGDTRGMAFPPLEELVAQDMLGCVAHAAAAKALRAPLTRALA